jgi:ABC-type transport system involved in multi-copper enzyme maturation permease subunit
VRRRAFWVAISFFVLICVMVVVSGFRAGQRGMSAPFVPPFSWAMTAAQVSLIPTVFLALTIVMLVTSEYSWRTARQNVIDGLSKEQFFAAKWLMAMMVTIAFTLLPFAVATGTVIYGRLMGATPATLPPVSTTATQDSTARAAALQAFNDSTRKALAAAPTAADSARITTRRRADSTQAALQQALRDVRSRRPRGVFPAPDPNAPLVSLGDLKVAGGYALGAIGFAAMAFMLAMFLRSTGGAVGVFFLYILFLEQLIGLMLRQFGSAELASKVMPYMPVNALRGPMNPDVWHTAYVERLNTIAASVGQPAQVVNADMLKLIGLPLAWIAVFLGVTFVVFRRRDL